MIVSCNKNCRINNGTTNAKLNIDTDVVVCDVCGDDIENISDFAKNCMKFNNDIIRERSISSFVFKCTECNKDVKTVVCDNIPKGRGCDGQCSINISEEMINAIREFGDE